MKFVPFSSRIASWSPETQYFPTCILWNDQIKIHEALTLQSVNNVGRLERGERMQKQMKELEKPNRSFPCIYVSPWKNLPQVTANLFFFCVKSTQSGVVVLGTHLSRLVACGVSVVTAVFTSGTLRRVDSPSSGESNDGPCPAGSATAPRQLRQSSTVVRAQDFWQEFIIAQRQIKCHARYVEPHLAGIEDICHRPIGGSRTFGPITGPQSGRGAFASVLTAWQIPSDVGPEYLNEASEILDGPISAQLLDQVGTSVLALVFPDSVYQVTRAIEYGWDLSWYDGYRAGLPKDKFQDNCYLHAIGTVVTKKDVIIATQGDCMAHLVTGSQIKCLAGSTRRIGSMTQGELDAAYSATPKQSNLPIRLAPSPHAKPEKPNIVVVPRSQCDGSVLVLTTPGTYDALFQTYGSLLDQAWFASLMISPDSSKRWGFVGDKKSAGPRSGGVTVLDFSDNSKGER